MAKTVLDVSCPNCGVRLLEEEDEAFCPNCLKVIDLSAGIRVTGSTHKVKPGSGSNEMQTLLTEVLASGNLTLTADTRLATTKADVVMICVGTPIDSRKKPNLRALLSALKEIGRGLKRGTLVVLKSTVPPGTTKEVVGPLLERVSGLKAGKDFGLAHAPETTLEGLALLGYRTLPKTVGGIDSKSSELAAAVLSVFDAPVYIFQGPSVTEAGKLFQNVYRDVNIALANELALAAERLGVDVTQAIEAALTEPKTHLLTPGPGAGGYCLPKDSYYLVAPASKLGYRPRLLTTARAVNDGMPRHVVDLVKDALAERRVKIAESRIAILGLSFKANTADTRESPSLRVVALLARAGAKIAVHDPLVEMRGLKLPRAVTIRTADLREALKGADALVLMTDHLNYRSLRLDSLPELGPKLKTVIDARHVFDPAEVISLGYGFRGVGRTVG